MGTELRRLRLRRNLTQEELAAMTDLTQRTISMIENGRSRPRLKTLRRLADALEVALWDIDPELAASYELHPTKKMPDKVAKSLLSLANALARKYARWPGERDELRSAGQDGLWEAWTKFDPTRGVPFEKFAAKRIKWRILDKARELSRDTTTINYGFGSMPRLVREFVDAGSSDEEDDRN